MGKIWENTCSSGWLWPDWGNTAWAAMAGLGSEVLKGATLLFLTFLTLQSHSVLLSNDHMCDPTRIKDTPRGI